MTVEVVVTKPNKFNALATGDVFKWKRCYFMKIKESVCSDGVINCVLLNTGNVRTGALFFCPLEQDIEPVKAILKVIE